MFATKYRTLLAESANFGCPHPATAHDGRRNTLMWFTGCELVVATLGESLLLAKLHTSTTFPRTTSLGQIRA
jgi:hypothetical protein